MSRNKHTEEVQFDEYGNPFTATDEPEYQTEETQAQEPEVNEAPTAQELLDYAILLASREPGKQYAEGQAGTREFTFKDVIEYAYRLDVPMTDAQIKSNIRRSANSGNIVAKGSKRGRFCAGKLMLMSHDDLMAEFNASRARRNPTKR